MKNVEEKSIIDRVISSFLFSSSILMTIVLAPIIFIFKSGFPDGFKFYNFYTNWLFITLVIASTLGGYLLGPDNCFKVLGHLWYTEKPHNNNVTITLWAILIAVGVVSYVYSYH